MKILVLGGTSFFGKNLVNELIKKGHDVTIGTRGIAKDDFGDLVKRIKLDRSSEESMEKAIIEKYDVIYDNIMYSSNDAKKVCEIVKDKAKKYIFISSVAVYENGGVNLKEEDFNPYNHEIKFGDFRKEFTYSEGKQNGEAYIFNQEGLKAIGVRFPVVIGPDDNTERVQWYTETIREGKPFSCADLNATFVAISSKEAGEILEKLAHVDFQGPINVTSNGSSTIGEVIEIIEEVTDSKANIVEMQEGVEQSPYDKYSNLTTNNSRVNSFGYEFREIEDIVRAAVEIVNKEQLKK